ncbi:hypothetical protein [Edaphobacillus lindanitolerans]|uniref:Apea-like HEPN domain-containing protein n=1 Tax=Edaphobacillus lindanitolerans TaxID=550447 RepID=A0A1U7PSK8_9BACI|nr:hypothetical protein [Edaphobacillus lindanitolerans]SIT90600.1 hypothetical protein SAMN05428946_2485 [Edaphobacillus lindanitolerans]
MFNTRTIEDLSYKETVDKIVELNEHIQKFWSKSQGWAPIDAANLLSKSRLDWLVSLSHSLYKWESDPSEEAEYGDLILAWANLGALVEGSMKFFLSVYYEDYKNDKNAIILWGKQIDPDGAMFGKLKEFFKNSVWLDHERKEKNDWLSEIQQKRNAIHAYRERTIDDFISFRKQVKNYLSFLIGLLRRVPYPDDIYGPDLLIW